MEENVINSYLGSHPAFILNLSVTENYLNSELMLNAIETDQQASAARMKKIAVFNYAKSSTIINTCEKCNANFGDHLT